MKIKKICFLAGIYPTEQRPKAAVFYQNLVNEMAKKGIDCRVIYPFAINKSKDYYNLKKQYLINEDYSVTIYRPKTITLGARKLGLWNTAYITACLYTQSAKKLLKKINWKPDIFYGHFISPAGIMAAKLSNETGIPAFVAYGESRPWSINTIGVKRTQKKMNSISGFISVSTKNKNDLINLGIATGDKIKVFPNGINCKVFYKRNKIEARKKMGWDLDKFIVAFVGHYNRRKGILRLDEAVKKLPDVYVAYAGDGELKPTSNNIIHQGNVSPNKMALFLSAADIFVLPTLNEGCCNAIIEAMACGLPIISSDRLFNYDILSKDNAILIDPTSISDIRNAIINIKDNKKLRKDLATRSMEVACNLTIERRVENILNWMEYRINNN
ncbi:MAG: glycosyltransferase [bacterium]